MNAKARTNDFVVFYAWQANLPDATNKRLIRDALRIASSRLEEEYSDTALRIIVDEATSERPGSPNIPATILEKVKNADAFVCDLTTINEDAPEGQERVPNPNVIFELGYAVAYLGWDRIVMLFNTAYGSFPNDVPFDIDRQRASPYKYSLPDKDERLTTTQLSGLKKHLINLVFAALKGIIEHNPVKPMNEAYLTPEEKKRRSDISTLKLLLSSIHIPTLDEHLVEAPHKVNNKVFHFWESFNAIVSSNLFYLYDERLRSLVSDVRQSWCESLSYGDQYHGSPWGDAAFFSNPGDMPLTDEQQRDWNAIEQSLRRLGDRFQELLQYVRESYLEVDIEESNRAAWEDYIIVRRLEESKDRQEK